MGWRRASARLIGTVCKTILTPNKQYERKKSRLLAAVEPLTKRILVRGLVPDNTRNVVGI